MVLFALNPQFATCLLPNIAIPSISIVATCKTNISKILTINNFFTLVYIHYSRSIFGKLNLSLATA
jgi:hypothetical protein